MVFICEFDLKEQSESRCTEMKVEVFAETLAVSFTLSYGGTCSGLGVRLCHWLLEQHEQRFVFKVLAVVTLHMMYENHVLY